MGKGQTSARLDAAQQTDLIQYRPYIDRRKGEDCKVQISAANMNLLDGVASLRYSCMEDDLHVQNV